MMHPEAVTPHIANLAHQKGCVEIPLFNGMKVLIDEEDADKVLAFTWTADVRANGKVYVTRIAKIDGKKAKVYLHRFVMQVESHQLVDHINRNPLDNRKSNLRIATVGQNGANRTSYSKTGFKGVWVSPFGRFVADIRVNKKKTYLGAFDTPEEAAKAYDIVAIKAHGEFAVLNFPSTHES